MKAISYFKLFTLVLLTTVFAAAQSLKSTKLVPLKEIIKAGKEATTNKYPNSDQVILADYTLIKYSPNGAYEQINDSAIKILTEKGKREERTSSIGYDTAYGTAMVIKAEIIKPSGKIIPVDLKENSKDMIESSQMNMNIYNPNSRVVRVSFPDLEIGDIVHLVAKRIESKPRVPNTWSDIEIMETTIPIVHQIIKILAPKKLPLKHIVLKNERTNCVTYTKKIKSKYVVHTWNVKNVPRIFSEPGMPDYKPLQHLLVSTIPKWEQVSKWYYNLCEPRLRATTPEMSNVVEELVADITDRDEKIKAIFKYVSQKIRYMGITTEDTAPGYEPHDVSITFENKYGVCRDKAALLAAMLRIAGFKAYTTLMLAGRPKKDDVVPNPFFNHAITAVKNKDGSYTLMDTTDETTKDLLPVYLNNYSYMVADPHGEKLKVTPVVPAEKNLVKVTTEAKYDKKGNLKAKTKIVFEGINDRMYRGAFARMELDEIRRIFEGAVKKAAPGAKITEFSLEPDDMTDLTQPILVEIEYVAPDLFISGKNETMVHIPWFGGSIGLVGRILSGNFGLDKRKYPMKTDIACGVKESVNVNIQDAVGKIVSLPKYDEINDDLIKWDVKLNADDGVISGNAEFLVKAVEFSTNQYLKMKKYLKTIEYNNKKKPIFATLPASEQDDESDDEFADNNNSYSYTPEGDVEVLERVTEISLDNSRNWSVVKKVTKKILTYAGKKDNAEIKIHYNPTWENVEILNALVTDADGNEKTLRKEEINLMDEGWVASAPRYPPSKILVASLPDVDIDAEIHYEIKYKYKKHPFFGARKSFNSFDLIDEETFRIIAPPTTKLKVKNPASDSNEIEFSESKDENNGKKILEWKAYDQRPVRKENQLPPWYYFNPTIFVSSGNWVEYASKLSRIFNKAANNQTICSAKAKEITSNAKTQKEKIIAIRDFVAKNIRSAGPSFVSLPLSSITPADITLKDGYGNSADKAILIYSMLKSIGLSPQFVLSSWLSKIEKVRKPVLEYPTRSSFGGVLVKIKTDEGDVYLNDTSQYAELGTTPHDGHPGLLLPDGKIEIIKALPNKSDKSETEYNIKLSENGDAEITRIIKYFGSNFEANKRYFKEITPEKRKRYIQNIVSSISQGAKLIGDLITKFDAYPGIEKLTVKIEKFAVRDGNFIYLQIPESLNNVLGLSSDVRDNPIAWNNETKRVLTTNVELPTEFNKVKLSPPNLSWNAPENAGTIASKTIIKNNKVTIINNIDIKPAIIPQDNYDDLLEANRKFSHPRMRTLLISK